LAEWQAQRLEQYAAALRISGRPLQDRIPAGYRHASPEGTLRDLSMFFVSTDEDLIRAWMEESIGQD
jgi:hypothetical protein